MEYVIFSLLYSQLLHNIIDVNMKCFIINATNNWAESLVLHDAKNLEAIRMVLPLGHGNQCVSVVAGDVVLQANNGIG